MLKSRSKFSFIILLVITGGMLSGCIYKGYKPSKTSLELQAIQANEFEAPFKIGFSATLSVFQDLGYIISTADAETGLISASSPKSQEFNYFMGQQVMKNRRATAFIETMPSGMIRIRLNFVDEVETSTQYGQKGATVIPVEEPKLYQETFDKMRKAIFVRTHR